MPDWQYLRYQAFLELGVETVPCLVLKSRDLYTPNRQVNGLSHKQESRMLRKALETLDEKTVAAAFGMESIGLSIPGALAKKLHPDVIELLNANKLSQQAARELTYVTPKRQREILTLIEKSGDASMAFVKTQVLKTSASQRTKRKKRANPWDASVRKKRSLVKKLAEVEDQYDFYSTIYRQYVADLLKLAIYVRQIVTKPELREYLAEHHADALDIFDRVLAESEGKAAG